jgi:hypothetical protein
MNITLYGIDIFSSLLNLTCQQSKVVQLAFHILFGRLQQSFRLGNLLVKFLPFGFKLPYFPSTLR